jgi:hypothetical protein
MMFRRLPQQGGDPRQTAEIVNRILDGKINSVGLITLDTGGATTTTLYDERISEDSIILFAPYSAAAATDGVPYGAFQDDTDQSATTTVNAYAMSFNTTDFSNGVAVVSNTQLTVDSPGVYNLQFSAQFANDDSQVQDVDVWFRKNGTDIPKSNSRFSIDSKHGSVKGHLIAALNFFVDLDAGDYIEIMWATTSVLVILEHLGTASSPTRPSTPSVIATMQMVSESSTSDIYTTNQIPGQATVNHFGNKTAGKTYRYVVLG